jgi:hypothetical protein
MFKGIVTLSAHIKGNGLKFPLCEFNPGEPGVDKVEIEGPKGDEIKSTVHLASVETREAGKALAMKVNTAALDRISYLHDISIENHKITGGQLVQVNAPAGTVEPQEGSLILAGGDLGMLHSMPAESLKAELEQRSLPGEQYYGLLRSARQSMSPVEEFIQVYNLLLMLHNNGFKNVDDFIRNEDSAVPQTPSPHIPGVMETVYTRLRHELGHSRVGVNLDETKAEMTKRVGALVALTKRAIESHP